MIAFFDIIPNSKIKKHNTFRQLVYIAILCFAFIFPHKTNLLKHCIYAVMASENPTCSTMVASISIHDLEYKIWFIKQWLESKKMSKIHDLYTALSINEQNNFMEHIAYIYINKHHFYKEFKIGDQHELMVFSILDLHFRLKKLFDKLKVCTLMCKFIACEMPEITSFVFYLKKFNHKRYFTKLFNFDDIECTKFCKNQNDMILNRKNEIDNVMLLCLGNETTTHLGNKDIIVQKIRLLICKLLSLYMEKELLTQYDYLLKKCYEHLHDEINAVTALTKKLIAQDLLSVSTCLLVTAKNTSEDDKKQKYFLSKTNLENIDHFENVAQRKNFEIDLFLLFYNQNFYIQASKIFTARFDTKVDINETMISELNNIFIDNNKKTNKYINIIIEEYADFFFTKRNLEFDNLIVSRKIDFDYDIEDLIHAIDVYNTKAYLLFTDLYVKLSSEVLMQDCN
ncbi:hypothetical protein COBT_000459 [Conglomerata obtusa]